MKKTRRKFSSDFKVKVVLESLRERQTLQQLAEKFEIHPNQISAWKKDFLDNASKAFSPDGPAKDPVAEKEKEALYSQIGRLQMENAWLKKKVL